MVIRVDFNSDEALYIQLCNQIILGIASSNIQEGETLPSVRELADNIGINMHTVNKAYSILKQEGFLKLDRRKGAVISLDLDKTFSVGESESDKVWAIIFMRWFSLSALDAWSLKVACKSIGPPLYRKKMSEMFF